MSWRVDNSGLLIVSGDHLKLSTEGGERAMANAMWMEVGPNEDSGCSVWRFKMTSGGGMWVGVCTEDGLGPSYSLRGLMYGGPGNLSEGGCLVTPGWGPSLREGDTVDMKTTVSADRVTVEYGRNGFYLGVAFDISGWTGPPLRPAVRLHNGNSLTISKVEPSEFPQTEQKLGDDVVNGLWKSEDGSYHLGVSMDLEKGLCGIDASVCNSFSCGLKFDHERGVWVSNGICDTTLVDDPETEALEGRVMGILESISKICRSGPQLVITTETDTHRFNIADKPGPATRDKIRWMK